MLAGALKEAGYPKVEVHDSPQILHGFANQTAQAEVRAAHLGFQPGPTGLGTAAALVGAMSRGADTPLNRG